MGKRKSGTSERKFSMKVLDGNILTEDDRNYVTELFAQIIVEKIKRQEVNDSNNSKMENDVAKAV